MSEIFSSGLVEFHNVWLLYCLTQLHLRLCLAKNPPYQIIPTTTQCYYLEMVNTAQWHDLLSKQNNCIGNVYNSTNASFEPVNQCYYIFYFCFYIHIPYLTDSHYYQQLSLQYYMKFSNQENYAKDRSLQHTIWITSVAQWLALWMRMSWDRFPVGPF